MSTAAQFTLNTDILERVDFPGGYFDGSGKIHYNITDWQGNVVMVVDNTGRPVQRVSYYPYGEPHREPSGQRYLYSGKERQNFLSSGAYDFRARQYSPALNQWYAPDRHAANYADISPYVFCGANPIKYTDPSGNDVVVLHKREHLAMLIQNESGKYQYYSINGNNIYISGYFRGGRPFNDIAVGEWDSAEDFLRSSYHSTGDKNDKENTSYFYYNNAYEIKTTPEQDKTIASKFKEISDNESYDFFVNNCATTVNRSLAAGGIEYPITIKHWVDINTGFSFIDKLIDKATSIIDHCIKFPTINDPTLTHDFLLHSGIGQSIEF